MAHFFLMQRFDAYLPYVIQPTWGGCGADLTYGHRILFTKDTTEFEGQVDVGEAGEYEILLLVQEGSVPGEEIFATFRIEQVGTSVRTLSRTTISSVDVTYEIANVYEIASTSFHPAGLGLRPVVLAHEETKPDSVSLLGGG